MATNKIPGLTQAHRLLDHFRSYYGGLICVCWSPDGKYVLTGGQDDLISIWHVPESVLIARCQGHHSWVTSVAFDPWRCDDKNYRFGSVGEDRRLCLWDFSVGMLHRPRGGAAAGGAGAHRGSIASRFTAGAAGGTLSHADTTGTNRSENNTEDDDNNDNHNTGSGGRVFTGPHPVEPRASTAILPPVLTKVVDADPLAWLEFTEEAIMTSCRSGTSFLDSFFSLCFFALALLVVAGLVVWIVPGISLWMSWLPGAFLCSIFGLVFEVGLLLRDPCASLTITPCLTGHIRTWNRPSDSTAHVGDITPAAT